MPNLEKLAGQAAIVAAGVILAGLIMHMFARMPIIAQAREGLK